MLEPPEVKHAMEVAKKQSTVSLSCLFMNEITCVNKFKQSQLAKAKVYVLPDFLPASMFRVILKDEGANIYRCKIALK